MVVTAETRAPVIVGLDSLNSRDNIRCLSHAAQLIILESDTQTETGTKKNCHRQGMITVCGEYVVVSAEARGDKLVFIVEIDTLYIHAGSRIVGECR